MPSKTLTPSRDERNAWILWRLFFGVVALAILQSDGHSVAYQYWHAAQNWLNGEGLYENGGRGFIYLPQAAVLFVPFSLLPRTLAEIVWRLLTISTFAAGVFHLCRLAESGRRARLFPLVTALTIPISWSAARNGQATLVIAGLMMLAVDEFSRRNWTRTTVLLCLGLAFKPLTLVLMLLMAALQPRLIGRLILGIGLVLAVPYLTQDWRYVTAQYVSCVDMLRMAAQLGVELPWAQLFGMLQLAGIPVSEPVQTALRVGFAGFTLAAALLARRRLVPTRGAVYLYALAACYLMLFNPRTENNTYALVAPAIGLFCAEAFLVDRNALLGTVIGLFALGVFGSYEASILLVPHVRPVWMAPLMCVGFSVTLLIRLIRDATDRTPSDPVATLPLPVASHCEYRLAG